MVQEARNKGVDAYYYHGQSMSVVCIGTWPADAVKQQDIDGSEAIADPDDAMLITSTPLPSLSGGENEDQGRPAPVPYAERIDIADKSLSATFKEYPYNYVNYEATGQAGEDGGGEDRNANCAEPAGCACRTRIRRRDPAGTGSDGPSM